eukprot:14210079-Ditylum_brightwellii.AAC.1
MTKMKPIINRNRRHNQGIMPLPQHCNCCGNNENSGGSDSPPSCNAFSQEESEVEESKNSPSQWPHRAGANYGPPSVCTVNKPKKAMGVKKTAEEDDGKEKGP